MPERQTTNAVMMIRPARFCSNPQTAASNAFQHAGAHQDPDAIQLAAEREFDGLAAALENAGVEVAVVTDGTSPDKPDAVFPNNWLSTHADGTVVLYPMQALNRRWERRPQVICELAAGDGLIVGATYDLSDAEQADQFLEGTGSLVLDRAHRIAYACLSPRTNPTLLERWCGRMGYEAVSFAAVSDGRPIYHTNVMMSVGERLAVVCFEAITADEERRRVRDSLIRTGHDLLAISVAQMHAFAGNMLELQTSNGRSVFVMSQRAYGSLTAEQRAQIREHSDIVSVPIPTIEDHAGGSVRCMLGEIFLPKNPVGAIAGGGD
jgi:hypothetical protein